ncbi:MAG: phage tail protein [Candidatus Omnitrophica bacterium]|nr:phage tail protein [Candidatus Omnitrophota bacterium]
MGNTAWLNYYPVLSDVPLAVLARGDYRLEVRDSSGTLLAEMTDIIGGKWIDEVNAPGSLEITYPAENSEAKYFVPPNEVWLYRGPAAKPLRAFIVQAVTWTDGETRDVTVQCEGLLAQWGLEVIRSYDAGGVVTVRTVLDAWINDHQNLQPGIYLGLVDPWIQFTQVTAAAENKTILQALRDLHEAIGGYYYVTPERRLCWKGTIGNDEGHVIRYGRNAIQISRSIDYRTINNRLVGTGVVNGTDETVTRNDSQSQSAYGIRTGFYEAPDTMLKSDLTALTDAELVRRSVPETVIEVESIDLSHVDYLAYEWEALALEPGSRVTLMRRDGDRKGLAISCRVYRIERDLMNPEKVKLEIGDTSRSVGNVITYRPQKSWLDSLARVMGYVQRQVQSKAGIN